MRLVYAFGTAFLGSLSLILLINCPDYFRTAVDYFSVSPDGLYAIVGDLPWKGRPIKSYAGLIPILESTERNSSIFYWYFPAQNKRRDAPIILWLQGGPGSSSLIGLFYENGPMTLNADMKLEPNPNSWNKAADMLFLDSPVGTGFSFVSPSVPPMESNRQDLNGLFKHFNSSLTSNCSDFDYTQEKASWKNGFPENQAAVSTDLIVFLRKFFTLHPSAASKKLILAGESYAGKYIPSLAYRIHRLNAESALQNSSLPKIHLQGIAIGDAFVDPISQIKGHAPMGLGLGLISEKQAEEMEKMADLARNLMCQGQLLPAADVRFYLFDYYNNCTGHVNWYDIRLSNRVYDRSRLLSFLSRKSTKLALNLPPSLEFSKDENVYSALSSDIMKSSRHYLPEILNAGYTVLLYQGQFDFRDGILGSTNYISSIPWDHEVDFLNADREIWKPKDDLVAGYITQSHNLVRYELLNAGHLAPGDQPFVTLQMMAQEFNLEV